MYDKYKENAWDNVELTEERKKEYEEKIRNDEAHIKTGLYSIEYNSWDIFYRKHKNLFFKDRKWIKNEFPELNSTGKRVLEIGCGTGSTLSQIASQDVYGIDCSARAIEIISSREELKKKHFCVHDISSEKPIPYSNMDYILLIFTLSAIHPSSHVSVLKKARDSMNKGGVLLFRDYAEMDMTQIRFKPHQILEKGFYKRGDGTYAYFFTRETLESIAKEAGLKIVSVIEEKKLLINRKKKIEMHRHWIQMKMERVD